MNKMKIMLTAGRFLEQMFLLVAFFGSVGLLIEVPIEFWIWLNVFPFFNQLPATLQLVYLEQMQIMWLEFVLAGIVCVMFFRWFTLFKVGGKKARGRAKALINAKGEMNSRKG